MVKTYKKGYRGEIQLVHELSKRGFMVVRTPRSGRINLASPDIIAAKDGKLIVIECKSRKNAFKIKKEQLNELMLWEKKAGAIPYIGWKIVRKGWVFLKLEDVLKNNGNVGKRFALSKGIGIDEL